MSDPAARLDDVTVAFPPLRSREHARTALDHLDLTAPVGQVTVLVGANGAGKTTALRALTGVIPVLRGTATVRGERMDLPESRLPRGVGVVTDSPLHPNGWSAEDIVRLHRRVDPDLDAHDFGRRLRRHGIDPAAETGSLSSGQRTLLQLDLALACAPDVLVLDEPFARLDPLLRRDLVDDLREHLAADEEGAILLSTHDLDGLERFADQLVVLVHGRAVLAGEPGELAEDHLVLTLDPDSGAGVDPEILIGRTRHGERVEALVRAEDAVTLPRGSALSPASVQDVVTFTIREASR